jgi:hypothetical protein
VRVDVRRDPQFRVSQQQRYFHQLHASRDYH